MNRGVHLRLETRIAQFEAQLEARRQRLSRLLAFKPRNRVHEIRREAVIQRVLNSVEARSQFVGAYKAHLEALQHELLHDTVTNVAPGSNPSDTRARGDLGDN
jgi:hypothetical protein